jgi:thiosulfate/3-mercaptopyruvate sulfurtransferase
MKQPLLLSAHDLDSAQKNNSCLVVDCRFVLSDPAAGHASYLEAHIPGAVYAHLDNDLSGPVTSDSGRHPLPNAVHFADFLARSGWQPGIMLVAYDDAGGSIAARLWWLMKYFGHDCAALLDGGFPAWQAAGYELESGPVSVAGGAPVSLCGSGEFVVSTLDIQKNLENRDSLLADVRAAERFRGDVEPIDSVAGHIPGSVNYPFQLNLLADARFKAIPEIRTALLAMSENRPAQDVVFMCGSGVTACHTIFAAELAGLEGTKLYAGSWSEWIRDPSRPVEPA